MTKLYTLPACLAEQIDEQTYIRWLRRKAAAHVKRDRKRCAWDITGETYRRQIHAAVIRSIAAAIFFAGLSLGMAIR